MGDRRKRALQAAFGAPALRGGIIVLLGVLCQGAIVFNRRVKLSPVQVQAFVGLAKPLAAIQRDVHGRPEAIEMTF